MHPDCALRIAAHLFKDGCKAYDMISKTDNLDGRRNDTSLKDVRDNLLKVLEDIRPYIKQYRYQILYWDLKKSTWNQRDYKLAAKRGVLYLADKTTWGRIYKEILEALYLTGHLKLEEMQAGLKERHIEEGKDT